MSEVPRYLAVAAVVLDVLGAAVERHLPGEEEHVVPHLRQHPVPPVDARHLQTRSGFCQIIPIGTVLNLRTTTSQKCEAVPRRARI